MGTNPTQRCVNLRFTLHQSPRAESLSGVRSYNALQHKPFPFYFPKAGAFEQAHFWPHPWFNLPGRNQAPPNAWEYQSGLRTRGNPTPLTSKPLETSGIPLLPKYHLSPCSTPFLTSTETSQTMLHQPYHLSPQPFFKALRWLPPKSLNPRLLMFTCASCLTTDSTPLLKCYILLDSVPSTLSCLACSAILIIQDKHTGQQG